jgi:hypothetical protein
MKQVSWQVGVVREAWQQPAVNTVGVLNLLSTCSKLCLIKCKDLNAAGTHSYLSPCKNPGDGTQRLNASLS